MITPDGRMHVLEFDKISATFHNALGRNGQSSMGDYLKEMIPSTQCTLMPRKKQLRFSSG